MSSNQEIFNNFMSKVDLDKDKFGFDLIFPHKFQVHKDCLINFINGETGVCVDYSSINRKTKLLFKSFDTPNIIATCDPLQIFPSWDKVNKLDLKFNNKDQQYLCNIFLTFLVNSHISSMFEDIELEDYKAKINNKSKDIFIPEKIAGLQAIKAIRNRNKKKFNKNFKDWKKAIMISQENIEDTVMDGDLYSEEKQTIGWYGESIETNEEAYRKICEINKNMFNEFIVVDMIAEKVGWW